MGETSESTASRDQGLEVPRDFAWATDLGAVVSVHRGRLVRALLLVPAVAFPVLLPGLIAGGVLESRSARPLARATR